MIDRNERIAERAYRIWEDAGRPEGQDMEHWLSAEAELEGAGPAEAEEDAVASTQGSADTTSVRAGAPAPEKKRGLAA
jgi:hypothetical protein